MPRARSSPAAARFTSAPSQTVLTARPAVRRPRKAWPGPASPTSRRARRRCSRRSAQAKEQGVPAYIVFGDATLLAVAAAQPETLAGLDGITGIGAKKLEAYGEALLEVVATGAAAE
jgi:ATP-dependent DNA helicase RecQ